MNDKFVPQYSPMKFFVVDPPVRTPEQAQRTIERIGATEELRIEQRGKKVWERIDSIFEGFGVPARAGSWLAFSTGQEPDPKEPGEWCGKKEVLVTREVEVTGVFMDKWPYVRVSENPYYRIMAVEYRPNEDGDNHDPYITEDLTLNHCFEAQYFQTLVPQAGDGADKKLKTYSTLFKVDDRTRKLEFWNKQKYTPMARVCYQAGKTEKGIFKPVRGFTQAVSVYGFADEPADWRYALDKAAALLGALEGTLPVATSEDQPLY